MWAIMGMMAGCEAQKQPLNYAWDTPSEALEIVGTQNNGFVTFQTVMEEEGGVWFDAGGVVPRVARVSFNLYAWQDEKVQIDLKKDGKVIASALCVRKTAGADDGLRLEKRIIRFEGGNQVELEPMLEAWLLYRHGIFRMDPKYLGPNEEGELNWRQGEDDAPGEVLAAVHPEQLLTRVYEVMPTRVGGLSRLELSDYRTQGGIAWPTRMKLRAGMGPTRELRLSQVKINDDLPVEVQKAFNEAGK